MFSSSNLPWLHVVNVSGGKDSTATYLLALARGKPFTAVFADTGNEHEWTYEFVRTLPERTGGPSIKWVKADFSSKINRKRDFIARTWPLQGVPSEKVDRALGLLHPTGNPFLDLCLLKTRFPSSQVRFCTEQLKVLPIFEEVHRPALEAGKNVISWQGVRGEESLARSFLPKFQQVETHQARNLKTKARTYVYRPLIAWRTADVFEFTKRHNVRWNPLYDAGMSRVGCMPCIMCRKSEMRAIADRFPEHIDKIKEWESLVSEVSKLGLATFFSIVDTPAIAKLPQDEWSLERCGITARVTWSRTKRGGKEYDDAIRADEEFGTVCSRWGVCE